MRRLISMIILLAVLSGCATYKNYQQVYFPATKLTGKVDTVYYTCRWEKQFRWLLIKGKAVHVWDFKIKQGDSVTIDIRKLNQRLWEKSN
jgi:hypothetical protein